MNIQETAKAIMTKLDDCRFSIHHEPTLKQGIMELAEACGTKLKMPAEYDNGELGIVTDDGHGHDGYMAYGEVFAALLNNVRCRTGESKYGYTAKMMPCNGWCYVPYWDVEKMIKLAAEQTPDSP